MSHQEAKAMTAFATTFAVAMAYALHLARSLDAGTLADGAMAGRTILILIAAVVGAGIAGQVVLHLARVVLGREVEWDEDERDRLIDLRAMNVAFSVLGAGFLAAVAGLALGWPPVLALHAITGAMLLAGLTADGIRIVLHRRGG
ncbi:MAG: hypothetical protein ACK4TB_08780 [Gemmobacter sp.]